jgi:Tfp pilus assembly protein PilN
VNKEKDKIKVLRTASVDVLQPALQLEDGVSDLNIEGEDLNLQTLKHDDAKAISSSSQNILNSELIGVNLNKSFFIPALTEPSIYYHVFDGSSDGKSSKITQEIINDIQRTKNVVIDKDNLGYIELANKSLLSVFLSSGDIHAIQLINSLARTNGKRTYKIPSVKSSEISLAYYIAKRKKFFPDDHSLIVYIGKEYSKLIFLHGKNLQHIGTTLDIGTLNLHTYDVYFSKILLEMENGGINSLDNIVVCGEDDSENLILSFYGTFPEANVSRLEFDDLDISALGQSAKDSISSFSIPLSVAVDYYDEIDNEHKGINLLPKYVKEDQKVFQFGWHGYALIPVLFAATFFFTIQFLNNNKEIGILDGQVNQLTLVQRQNQETLGKIADLEAKISGFDQTQTILDSASSGTGVWSRVLSHISNFFEGKRNIWLTNLTSSNSSITLSGYALSKRVLTDFAYSVNSAELKSVNFEAIREQNAYKFNAVFNLLTFEKDKK